jgi:hypothetical protein
MKQAKAWVFSSLAAVLSLSASVAGPSINESLGEPEREIIVPEKAFVPTGFDDNDLVELVVAGNLPSTCYSAGIFTAVPFVEEKKIVIKQEALFYPKSWCSLSLVPYRETVKVGVLPAGEYQVVFVTPDAKLASSGKTVSVGLSQITSRDAFTYAVVENVALKRTEAAPSATVPRKVVIEGSLVNSCMSLKEVRVIQNDADVIELLPITQSTTDSLICQPQLRPFEVEVALPAGLTGEKLVHVRSLNGQAFNRVFRF